jgi:hypothetical protein
MTQLVFQADNFPEISKGILRVYGAGGEWSTNQIIIVGRVAHGH